MKKIFTVFALALISSGAFAQFNQGRMLVGGGFDFSVDVHKTETGSTTTKNGTSVSFGITPNFGYFVMDNLAVGASLGLNASTYTYADNNSTFKKSNSSSVNFIPFARYYVDPGIFFQVHAGGGGGTFKVDRRVNNPAINDEPEKTGTFTWGIGVGYAYFLNDFVAVEPMVLYSGLNTKYKSQDPVYTTKTSGPSLRVAFQIYLGDRN
ncbi:MAG TPA: outer membrane beta-barrel protein [Cyclobacteriaceae bacterium]|nr:outer membrane beta-barrel protein [Cyclobacteriaceae bacterium]